MLIRRSAIALSRRVATRPIIPRSFTTSVVRREPPNHYPEHARHLIMLQEKIKSPMTHPPAI